MRAACKDRQRGARCLCSASLPACQTPYSESAHHHQNQAGAVPVLLTLQPPASMLSPGHLYPPSKKEDLTGNNESTLLQPFLNLKCILCPLWPWSDFSSSHQSCFASSSRVRGVCGFALQPARSLYLAGYQSKTSSKCNVT